MAIDLKYLNIDNLGKIHRNMSVSKLIEYAVKKENAKLTENGSLVVNTGKYTGRSPKDRFIVVDEITKDKVDFGEVNIKTDVKVFNKLYNRVLEYLKYKDLFVTDVAVGALKDYSLNIRIITEYAWTALGVSNLFIKKSEEELKNFVPEFTVISAPGFKAKGKEDGVNSEAFIIINFTKKIVLIGGTSYTGEIKKAMFSIMNFILPSKGVLPMHCSANKGKNGDTVIFFGLSGTGKTTLSTSPDRKLIGDDEHGWCDSSIFNFEGGCYAKVIALNKEKESEIYNAIKFGTLVENVVVDKDGKINFEDDMYTQNTRAAYPLNYIENVDVKGIGNIPKKIIFLTADAFGVMPPISLLTKEAAMEHFMAGYTSKVAGTERGIKEPVATFSPCFGRPFMLLNPFVYAKLLGEKIEKFDAKVYLINTGWIGGSYGVGKRIDLEYTREMVNAVINERFEGVNFTKFPYFNLLIPDSCPNVPKEILDPRNLWDSIDDYNKKAEELQKSFENNYKKYNIE